MKTAAVIAEYNPFHKGHAWQLSQLRQRGASHIAVVMSPDFTQRGTPAILPKRVRAAAALQGGADLVLELPVCYIKVIVKEAVIRQSIGWNIFKTSLLY